MSGLKELAELASKNYEKKSMDTRAAMLFGLLLAACTGNGAKEAPEPEEEAECQKDEDCESMQVCDQGSCVKPSFVNFGSRREATKH